MSIKKKNVIHPSYREIELFYLNPSTCIIAKKNRDHLYSCPLCQKRLKQIAAFYQILHAEIKKSINPSILDFCKKLAPKGTKYGLLICSPYPEKNNHNGDAYFATLAFSANGELSPHKLSDFSLPKGKIGIILYADLRLKKLLLLPCSNDISTFSHWDITIPGILEHGVINSMGAVKIDLLNFELLNNHLVYFKHVSNRQAASSILNQLHYFLAC